MLEKILLAVMVTFSIDLFLGVHLQASPPTAVSSGQLADRNLLVLLFSKRQAFRQNLIGRSAFRWQDLSPRPSVVGCQLPNEV